MQDLRPWDGPAILLVDLDAFFASVEQRDHPGWKGKPVIVGGDPEGRGVVSTASYEARAFGVRSAMPSSTARDLCPQAIWTRGDHAHYKRVSSQIMAILADETPFMQQVSIDEAFLDVTPTRANPEHPFLVAQRIQRRVLQEVGVTCSVGVGVSKVVAKIASEVNKPHGITVVYPGEERAFLGALPVRKLSGVGESAQRKLRRFGIATLGDLAAAELDVLRDVFGKNAQLMRDRAAGIDHRPVRAANSVKSVSNETSFAADLTQRPQVWAAVLSMAAKVGRRLRAKGLCAGTVVLKLRLGDRSLHTVQRPLAIPTNDDLALRNVLDQLLDQAWRSGLSVRLVGVGATRLFTAEEAAQVPVQQDLFGGVLDGLGEGPVAAAVGGKAGEQDADLCDKTALDPLSSQEKRAQVLSATDAVRQRFGKAGVCFGFELRNAENTTGTQPM